MVIFDGYDSASTKDMTHQRRKIKRQKGYKSFLYPGHEFDRKQRLIPPTNNGTLFIWGRHCVNPVVNLTMSSLPCQG